MAKHLEPRTALRTVVERRRRIRAATRRAVRRASRRVAGALGRRYAGLLAYLAILGPGLISANAGNDAGGIATYASAGASYGYSLLWVLLIITLSLAVVQEMCARMGTVTGKGLSDLIRENFGIRWTLLAVAGLFVANAGLAVSEFVGIAAVADLFNIPRFVLVPLAALVLWAFVVFGSYRTAERVFLLFTLPFLAYPIAAFLARPDWGAVAHGTFVPTFRADPGYIMIVVALIGTTVTPYMQLYVESSVAEKGVTPEEYPLERVDVYTGAIFGDLMSFFIIVATGATLFVHGVQVETAADAARALEPFAGPAAKLLFGVGLFGASMLAAVVLPLTTAYSLSEAFGFEKGISRGFREAPVFMGIFTGMIGASALAALIPGIPIISLLLVIQVVNGVLSPIVLIAALRLTNNREVMGDHCNGPVFNVVATVTVVAIIILTAALLAVTVAGLFT